MARGTKPTHNPAEVFDKYLGLIKKGFKKQEAAKKCGISRSYPGRNFTAEQNAVLDQEYYKQSYRGMTNRPPG